MKKNANYGYGHGELRWKQFCANINHLKIDLEESLILS